MFRREILVSEILVISSTTVFAQIFSSARVFGQKFSSAKIFARKICLRQIFGHKFFESNYLVILIFFQPIILFRKNICLKWRWENFFSEIHLAVRKLVVSKTSESRFKILDIYSKCNISWEIVHIGSIKLILKIYISSIINYNL